MSSSGFSKSISSGPPSQNSQIKKQISKEQGESRSDCSFSNSAFRLHNSGGWVQDPNNSKEGSSEAHIPAIQEQPITLFPGKMETTNFSKPQQTYEASNKSLIMPNQVPAKKAPILTEVSDSSSKSSESPSESPLRVPKIAPDSLLLKMLDTEKGEFLLMESDAVINDDIIEFLTCNIEVITKKPFPFEGKPPSLAEWVQVSNHALKYINEKRNDQKLRMIFKKIIKMLINSDVDKVCSGRELKPSRMNRFMHRYAPKNPEHLNAFVNECKFPSKKKLKAIFLQYPLLGQAFYSVLSDGSFLRKITNKRKDKARKLFETFMIAKIHSKSYSRIHGVQALRECLKSYPWSMEDLNFSCEMIYGILRDAGISSKDNPLSKPKESLEKLNEIQPKSQEKPDALSQTSKSESLSISAPASKPTLSSPPRQLSQRPPEVRSPTSKAPEAPKAPQALEAPKAPKVPQTSSLQASKPQREVLTSSLVPGPLGIPRPSFLVQGRPIGLTFQQASFTTSLPNTQNKGSANSGELLPVPEFLQPKKNPEKSGL